MSIADACCTCFSGTESACVRASLELHPSAAGFGTGVAVDGEDQLNDQPIADHYTKIGLKTRPLRNTSPRSNAPYALLPIMNSPTVDSVYRSVPASRLNRSESPTPKAHGASPIAVATRYIVAYSAPTFFKVVA
jgi:hypothetical protein